MNIIRDKIIIQINFIRNLINLINFSIVPNLISDSEFRSVIPHLLTRIMIINQRNSACL